LPLGIVTQVEKWHLLFFKSFISSRGKKSLESTSLSVEKRSVPLYFCLWYLCITLWLMLQSELPTLMHNDASKSVAISYFSL